jgi:hypothetical protein
LKRKRDSDKLSGLINYSKSSINLPLKENKNIDEDVMSQDNNIKEDIRQEIENAIRGLLFYKIEMPTNSSNKSIMSYLDIINSKLNDIKNCNVYLVYTL